MFAGRCPKLSNILKYKPIYFTSNRTHRCVLEGANVGVLWSIVVGETGEIHLVWATTTLPDADVGNGTRAAAVTRERHTPALSRPNILTNIEPIRFFFLNRAILFFYCHLIVRVICFWHASKFIFGSRFWWMQSKTSENIWPRKVCFYCLFIINYERCKYDTALQLIKYLVNKFEFCYVQLIYTL